MPSLVRTRTLVVASYVADFLAQRKRYDALGYKPPAGSQLTETRYAIISCFKSTRRCESAPVVGSRSMGWVIPKPGKVGFECVVDAGRFHYPVIDIPPDTICPRCDLIFNDTAELQRHLASMEYHLLQNHYSYRPIVLELI